MAKTEPCPEEGCSNLKGEYSQRCRPCSDQLKRKNPTNYCACGKKIRHSSKRCHPCAVAAQKPAPIIESNSQMPITAVCVVYREGFPTVRRWQSEDKERLSDIAALTGCEPFKVKLRGKNLRPRQDEEQEQEGEEDYWTAEGMRSKAALWRIEQVITN